MIWYIFLFTLNIFLDSGYSANLVLLLLQPYKCNKRLVISLNPLPHCGSTMYNEASCNTCNRKLTEPDLYRYCSISCKVMTIIQQLQPFNALYDNILAIKINFIVEFLTSTFYIYICFYIYMDFQVKAVLSKPNDSVPPFISIQNPPPPQEKHEETSEHQKPLKRRKGIPHRAPFF